MARLALVLSAILWISGCKAPGAGNATVDPFFGRTRVEPPRTGAISGQNPPNLTTPSTAPGVFASPSATQGRGPTPSTVSPWPATTPPAATAPGPQASGAQPSWLPMQPKTNAVPAAIPQGSSRYQPPDGSFSYPGGSSSSASAMPSAGPGDRLSIPAAAATMTVQDRQPVGAPSPIGPPAQGTAAGGFSGAGANTPWKGGGGAIAPAFSSSSGSPGFPGAAGSAGSGVGDRERIVRDLQAAPNDGRSIPRYSPYPANSGGFSTNATPVNGKERLINIMDLPEARS